MGSDIPGRALGVDLGNKRVGLALSDALRMIASPYTTIPAGSEADLALRLAALCREQSITLVVIGLPVSADGSEGPGCARARRVGARLGNQGIATAYQDESWTSRDAEGALRETGGSRRSDRAKIDAMAASLILREYLSESSRT
jgi:putative holliday junction resolvase